MFKVLDGMDKQRYQPRTFVAASTDRLALTKVQQHELRWASEGSAQSTAQNEEAQGAESGVAAVQSKVGVATPQCNLRTIPRSREVGQPWISSALSTLWASLFSLQVLLTDRPHLVLANGPGTCLPLCLLAQGLRVVGLLNVRVVFVESIARTQRLSMTGTILYRLRAADELFVQWEQLRDSFPRCAYAGRVY